MFFSMNYSVNFSILKYADDITHNTNFEEFPQMIQKLLSILN